MINRDNDQFDGLPFKSYKSTRKQIDMTRSNNILNNKKHECIDYFKPKIFSNINQIIIDKSAYFKFDTSERLHLNQY